MKQGGTAGAFFKALVPLIAHTCVHRGGGFFIMRQKILVWWQKKGLFEKDAVSQWILWALVVLIALIASIVIPVIIKK